MGASSVTRREAEILGAVRERLTNAEIAARFFISERTVESHVSSLLRKLGARDRVELMLMAPVEPYDHPSVGLPGAAQVLSGQPLVGRHAERTRLEALWGTAAHGSTTMAVLTGEAGVGKTRLAAEVASWAHGQGGQVLWGSCPEELRAPHQALTDALEAHRQILASDALDRELGGAAGVLARMLGMRAGIGPEGAPLVSLGTGAPDLARALRRYLGWLASRKPVLFVVEDLHWAAGSTRSAIHELVRSAGEIPLLVLVTMRDTVPDLDRTGELFLGRCELLPNCSRLPLGGFRPEEVAELLATLKSNADADHVRDQTGGNPLLVKELVSSRAPTGSSLTALLAPRYERLTAEAHRVLDAAAVLGSRFDVAVISRVVDRPIMDVIDALDEAERAGLIVADPDRPGRFSFVHPRFRTLHYEALRTRERLGLHHAAALALEQSTDDRSVVADLARHSCLAAPLGDLHAAIRYARRAAEVAERVLALDDAARYYRLALRVEELAPAPRDVRLRLNIKLGELLTGIGDSEGRALLLEAATEARELEDGNALADVAWGMVRFGNTTTSPGTTDAEFISIADDALRLLGDEVSAPKARVLAVLSTQLAVGGDPERGLTCIEEAVGIARGLDDPETLGVVLLAQRHAGGVPVRPELRLAIADELVELGERLQAPLFTINGKSTAVWAFRELGALERHRRALDVFAASLADYTWPYMSLLLELRRAAQGLLEGDLERAEIHLGAAEEFALTADADPVALCGPMHLALLHARGGLSAVVEIVEAQVKGQPGFRSGYEGLLALCLAAAGRDGEARVIVDAAANDGFTSLQRNLAYTSSLALFAETCEIIHHSEAAAVLIGLLEPFSGLLADNAAAILDPVDLSIAKVALTSGDLDRACASAERVLSDEFHDAPIFRARALVRLAAAGQRGADCARAPEPAVEEALAIAAATGAQVIEQDAERYGLLSRHQSSAHDSRRRN